MTVPSAVSSVSHAGNGAATVFAVPFAFLDNTHLRVTTTTAGVDTVKTLTTHYTVSGAGNPAGGSVTMLAAPANGVTLTIERVTPATQLVNLRTAGDFSPGTHEQMFDRVAMVAQELSNRTADLEADMEDVLGLTEESETRLSELESLTATTEFLDVMADIAADPEGILSAIGAIDDRVDALGTPVAPTVVSTFATGWDGPVEFWKDAWDVVHIAGYAGCGSGVGTSTIMAAGTLPVGSRPLEAQASPGIYLDASANQTKPCVVSVETNGSVTFSGSGVALGEDDYVYIQAIFRAKQ